jgi:hypothetical protein
MGTRTEWNDWPSDPWLCCVSTPPTVSLGVIIEGEDDSEDMVVVGVRDGLGVIRFDGERPCCGTW